MSIELTYEEKGFTTAQIYQLKMAHELDQASGAAAPEVKEYQYGDYIY